MRVELLCIDECPNSEAAGERLRAALSELNRPGVEVVLTVIDAPSEARGTAFAGSPTISVEGVDIFPGAAPASDLSCRVYQTPHGLAGLPTVDQIKRALLDHGLS